MEETRDGTPDVAAPVMVPVKSNGHSPNLPTGAAADDLDTVPGVVPVGGNNDSVTGEEEPSDSPRSSIGDGSVGSLPGPALPGPVWGSPFRTGLGVGFGLLVAALTGLMVSKVASTILLIGVAFMLAVSLRRVVDKLVRHGWPAQAAIAAVFGGLVAFFVIVTTLVIPPVVEQVTELATRLPAVTETIRSQPFVQNATSEYEIIRTALDEAEDWFQDGEGVLDAMGGIFGAGRAVATAALNAGITLVLTLYLLVALPAVTQWVYRFFPKSRRDDAERIGTKMLDQVGALVVGQCTVAGLNGFCSFLFLTVAGVPYAAALAILTAILGVIPLIGATLAAVIVALVAFVHSPILGLVVVGFYTAYQQVENYYIAPKIMRKVAHVPDVVTIVSALLGGLLYGIVGVILAIPAAAASLLIIREVVFTRQDQK